MRQPQPSAPTYELADGVVAVAPGLAWLPRSATLVAADVHFGYEDVVGGALPLWSTVEIATTLTRAIERFSAREVVFLGDVVHGAHMSDGAARVIMRALADLRTHASLTLVAGNHEGRSRAFAILGPTVEETERDGWRLVHGDKPELCGRVMIGHLHPSLPLGGGASMPAFLGSDRVIVLPALTPYSPGLNVLSEECAAAIGAWALRRADVHVTAVTSDAVFPFGTLATLRETLRGTAPRSREPSRFVRRRLRADG